MDQSIKVEDVVRFMKWISWQRGIPERVFLDNGPEFIGKALDKWAYENQVTLDFSRLGKPTDNAFVIFIIRFVPRRGISSRSMEASGMNV